MAFPKNKPHHSSSATPISEKPMNDSLRAAQIIFQKHSDQAGQSTPATPTTFNAPSSSPGNIRRGSSQSTPAKLAATAIKNKNVTPPLNNSNSAVFSTHTSSPNEQAYLAALLAHTTLNPDNEDESSSSVNSCNNNNNNNNNHNSSSNSNNNNHSTNNLSSSNIEHDKMFPVSGKQKQSNLIPNQHLAHLYRTPSSRTSSNVNVSNSTNDNKHTLTRSFEDLPKLEIAKHNVSPVPKGAVTATPSKASLPSTLNLNATPKTNPGINININRHHQSEQSLSSPHAKTPTEAQKQPLKQPVEHVKQQLKEVHRQPRQQVQLQHQQQQQQRLQSPPKPPPIVGEMSTPTKLPQRNLQLQTQQLHQNYQHPEEHSPVQTHPQLTPHPYSSPSMSNEFDNHSLGVTSSSQNSSQRSQQLPKSDSQFQYSPTKPISRTLVGRVPPPRIYLSSSGEEDGTTDFAADNETDATSEKPILKTKIRKRPRRVLDESSSSIISSESPVSYGLENSSFEDPRVATVDNFDEDLDDEVDENNSLIGDNYDYYDDYDDYDDDEDIEDVDVAEEYSLPPKTKTTPYARSYDYLDTGSLPNLNQGSTLASSYSGGLLAAAKPKLNATQPKSVKTYKTVPKVSQSQPQSQPQIQKKPQQTPPPYQSPQQQQQQQQQRQSPANVTYQGTLPDLIPNHTRRTKMDKLKTKIFGSHNNRRKHRSFDFPSDRTSITADPEGRAVVKTNQNMRFKTTMRKVAYDGSYNGSGNRDQGSDANEYGRNDFNDDSDEDSDSSVEQHREEKRNRNKGIGIRKKLKNTAAVVPYSDHLLNMDHRHAPKIFNEDKPWKSHNDVGFVTSQERKRYEGMWVSNRCMYLDLLPWWAAVLDGDSDINVQLPDDGLILNLVVKDIWSRSNLSEDLLLHIYDMVDTRRDGTLDRKSFVVGMWVVDQCLYGRKLPKEIDQKVWNSVDKYVVSSTNFINLRNLDRNKKKQMRQEIKNIKKDIKNVHS